MNQMDFYSFSCDFETLETIKKLNLYFYPRDNSIELYDVSLKRLFLKRSVVADISIDDMLPGSRINIFGKNILIKDYGSAETRRVMGNMKQKAFLMIKPEARQHVGDIISILERNKLLMKQLKMLKIQPLTAVQFCSTKTNDENVSLQMENLTAGPVVVMELLGENTIEQLKRICGPEDMDEAKRSHPTSLRAIYGLDSNKSAVLNPEDSAANQRDLDLFFSKSGDRLKVQAKLHKSTLCIIKPHAVKEGKVGAILKMISDNGYTISAMKMCHLDRRQAEEFHEIYKGVVGEYLQMVTQLQSGSCLALEIQGQNDEVQPEFRAFCGPADPYIGKILRPHTIRAKFGTDKILNAVHCTDLREDTMLELEYFFKIID